jgi:hypothetical protein
MPRLSRRAIRTFSFLICGGISIAGGMRFARSQGAKAAVFPSPNSDPAYQQLRQIGLGSDAFSVHDLVLKRDAATFIFKSGTLVFLAPVGGKVTGAVFSGEGTFSVTPPIATEQKNLSLLTRRPSLFDTFNELVLRFTDDTYPEVKISNTITAAPSANVSTKYFDDIRNALRKDHHYNLDARILQDVLSSDTGELFIAFIKSSRYGNRLAYWSDPHGSSHGMAPEEVQLATFDESRFGIWAAYHYSREYQNGKASGKQNNSVFRITSQELHTQIQPNGELHGKAVTRIVSQMNALRSIPFDLYPSLRVQSVVGADGQPLSFIQEDQHADSDFWVILPNDLNAEQELSITTTYGGKDAVVDEGGANYYPVARGNWYPSHSGWGGFATYTMNFSIPKGMQLVATGSPTGEEDVAKTSATKWKSDKPQPVAGFQFGKFKVEETKIPKLDNFEVVSFANQEMPSSFGGLQNVPLLGSMNTTSLLKKAMAEAELAVQLYTDYFGPSGFKRLAMTQQTATNYGQSWPEMVYLPITYFFDTTIRHQLGMDAAHGYFQVVAPHEVAHQWWGHTVSWASYRDQWMSEGFSDFSASLYIQLVWKDRPQDFVNFWNDEREMLTKKNAEGFRAIDVGPLTMGYRLNNSKAGFNITRELIYPKGAYILHMIRMMMWNQKTGDDEFKSLMHEFVKTYAGQSATTEDFKAMVEKHMTQQMDLEGDGKMDWFFNEYVYGTAVPTYTFDHTIVNGPSGDLVLNLKLTQSNVDDNFRMLVPIYLELADGKFYQVGRARITGNHSIEQQVPLRGLKDRPRRALINHYDDVLCTK